MTLFLNVFQLIWGQFHLMAGGVKKKKKNLDIILPESVFQLLQGSPQAFPSQLRKIISPTKFWVYLRVSHELDMPRKPSKEGNLLPGGILIRPNHLKWLQQLCCKLHLISKSVVRTYGSRKERHNSILYSHFSPNQYFALIRLTLGINILTWFYLFLTTAHLMTALNALELPINQSKLQFWGI